MKKEEALERCINYIKKYGYISEDDILDECEEEYKLVKYCQVQLQKLIDEGKLEGELDI
jgi:hypothetical protein